MNKHKHFSKEEIASWPREHKNVACAKRFFHFQNLVSIGRHHIKLNTTIEEIRLLSEWHEH